jgi:hypothetical protein
MAVESDEEIDDEKLANGDTVAERVEKADVDELDDDDTCSTDEMRERLGL